MESELLDRLNHQIDAVLQALGQARERIHQLEQELGECRAQKEQCDAHAHGLQERIDFEHGELESMANRLSGALEQPEHAHEGAHHEHHG